MYDYLRVFVFSFCIFFLIRYYLQHKLANTKTKFKDGVINSVCYALATVVMKAVLKN